MRCGSCGAEIGTAGHACHNVRVISNMQGTIAPFTITQDGVLLSLMAKVEQLQKDRTDLYAKLEKAMAALKKIVAGVHLERGDGADCCAGADCLAGDETCAAKIAEDAYLTVKRWEMEKK